MAETLIENVLSFIYTIGHWIGAKIVELIQYISGVIIPPSLVDAIGWVVIRMNISQKNNSLQRKKKKVT